MKAYNLSDGSIALFRPEQNARRFQASAARMTMPDLPEAVFLQAVEELVKIDSAWIPKGDGSLYLRPFMFATEAFHGVRPSYECITRDAIITLARKEGRTVREERYSRVQWRADAANGKLKEAFACGTAAVIASIGKIKSRAGDIVIADGSTGPVTAAIKAKLVGIQRGDIADEFGWVRRIS